VVRFDEGDVRVQQDVRLILSPETLLFGQHIRQPPGDDVLPGQSGGPAVRLRRGMGGVWTSPGDRRKQFQQVPRLPLVDVGRTRLRGDFCE
jgi:hypothetical protein